MAKKILEILPAELHDQLFAEVQEALKGKGYKIQGPEGDDKAPDEADKAIKAWADSNKKPQ